MKAFITVMILLIHTIFTIAYVTIHKKIIVLL